MKCRIVSNSSVRSRCVIVCEQSRTSSMVMPAWRSRGIDRAVFVVFVWSGTCVTCAPWKGANVLCTILCGLARTPTGLCCSTWCTRPTSQITGQRMRLLKSNAELEMLTAFKTFLTMMFLCCGRQRASCRPSLSVRQLLGSVKRVRLSTFVVLDMSFRVIGVRAGSFWARVACVSSSSLLLIVYTSSCICFATRIALCVCCFLSTSFVVV